MGNSEVMVKLVLSYGGKFVPHPKQLGKFIYGGGESKLIKVNRSATYSELVTKLRSVGNITEEFFMQYQLPGSDPLISIYNDDDGVESMMKDYDKVLMNPNMPSRLRLFLFYYPRNQPGDLLGYWPRSDNEGATNNAVGTSNHAVGADHGATQDAVPTDNHAVGAEQGATKDAVRTNNAEDGDDDTEIVVYVGLNDRWKIQSPNVDLGIDYYNNFNKWQIV